MFAYIKDGKLYLEGYIERLLAVRTHLKVTVNELATVHG